VTVEATAKVPPVPSPNGVHPLSKGARFGMAFDLLPTKPLIKLINAHRICETNAPSPQAIQSHLSPYVLGIYEPRSVDISLDPQSALSCSMKMWSAS